MPGTFFVTALRNLLRHKVQSFINLASLAIGMTVFGFTFLYVKQELSYDRAWPDAERIHRLVIEQRGIPGNRDGRSNSRAARGYQELLEYFAPQIDKATRLTATAARFKGASQEETTNLTFVDSEFLDIFHLEVVAGDFRRALSGPGFIAIEENYAATQGTNLAPGDRIVIQTFNDTELEYEVAAIYRLPQNISYATSFNLLTLIHEYSLPLFNTQPRTRTPWENATQVWLKLKPDISTEAFNAMQAAYIEAAVTFYDEVLGPDKNISDFLFYHWQPVTKIHFNPVDNEATGAGDPARVTTFAIIGLLVLLVGCSNSISLSLASAIERQREIGVRKTLGALPADILRQHLGEAVLLALIALMPAIALLELLLPAFQTLLPITAPIDPGWNEYLLLTLIVCLVGLANGGYPALILSRIKPQAVLKAGPATKSPGKPALRSLLVGVQFCFASMLLIGTAALYLQLAVIRSQPLGFAARNLVSLSLFNAGERANGSALINELEKIPGVIQVVPLAFPPASNISASALTRTVVHETQDVVEVTVQQSTIDAGFFDIVEIPLVAGRIPDPLPSGANRSAQSATPVQASEMAITVNRAAVRALGFASPQDAIEQVIFQRNASRENAQLLHTPMRIVGVVEDNMYLSLRRRPEPEMYLPISLAGSVSVLLLKYEDSVGGVLQERIQQTAQAVNGQPLQNLTFIEAQLDGAFRQEQNESRLLLICGALAILLACIGLYGLAAFAIERRTKEVGVRKVMGASVLTIVALYLWRFSRPVLVANIIAWPVAVYFVLQWIERFPYQLDKAWLLPLCVGATLVVLLIALLTVSAITVRAAAAKPIQSLRYE